MKKLFIPLLLVVALMIPGCSMPLTDEPGTFTEESSTQGIRNDTTGQGTGQEDNAGQPETVPEKSLSVTIYYQDNAGFIIPVSRKIEKQEGVARAAVTGLIDSAPTREEIEYYGLYPVLPQGTEIKGINIKDGTATIDFSSKLLEYSSEEDERRIIASIVYTLTEFKTVQNVRILVNGQAEGLKFGTDIKGELNRDNILINSKKTNLSKDRKKADIYLFRKANENYTYLLPVSMEYEGGPDENLPGKIIELYGQPYGSEKLYSEIPDKVSVKNVFIKNGLLTLDFGKELISYGGGTAREEGILKQIVYSMKQVKGISKVKILVEGKEDALPEGTIVSGGIVIPAEINGFMN